MLIDIDQKLAEWLRLHIDGIDDTLTIAKFSGGQSNPTFKIVAANRTMVLRVQPSGAVASAHAVDREFRVMRALEASNVPVPRTHALCTDPAIIGTPFYVMEYIEGRVVWDTRFSEAPSYERRAYFDAMNAALASLHSLDPKRLGLGDFGPRTHYVERQLRRWTRMYQSDVEAAGRVPMLEHVIDQLSEFCPPPCEARIVHGDFRCDNIIFQSGCPEIAAIIDWELSTLGDPMADFAYHLMMYRLRSGAISGLRGHNLAELCLPSEEEYVEAYCTRVGRSISPEQLTYYLAFNLFRLAAILHGIRARVRRGNATGSDAEERSAHLEDIAETAYALAAQVPRTLSN